MTCHRFLAYLLAVSMTGPVGIDAGPSAFAQAPGEPPQMQHAPLLCLEPATFPELDALVTSPSRIQRTRIYFKAHQFPDWYYIEMKAVEAARYMGLLPQPLAGTTYIDYYVYALDSQFQTGQTDQYMPNVTKDKCTINKKATKPAATPQIIVGGTKEGQPPIPPGFSRAGIIAFVTIAGVDRKSVV